LQVKLCDFGTGRKTSQKLGMSSLMEITTIFYCAPEGILNQTEYYTSVDMWALGCIMVEMLTRKPMLMIRSIISVEKGLLQQMVEICGKPTQDELNSIPESELKEFLIKLDTPVRPLLDMMLQNKEHQVVSLIKRLLSFDPPKRITAELSLHHPFINTVTSNNNGWDPPSDISFTEPLHNTDVEWTKLLQESIDNCRLLYK